MMKRLMNGCLVSILILAFFVATGMVFRYVMGDSLSKEKIFRLVDENYLVILEDIEKNNFDQTLMIKGIESVNQENGVFDFDCEGKGFGPETRYFGFYYAEDDLPKDLYHGTKNELIADGVGYSYKEEIGDNYYYTEKIRTHFYYYEMHF